MFNFLTNLVALSTLALGGQIVDEVYAVGMGTGAYIGARLATRKGTRLIKPIFVSVSTLLSVKLLWDYLAS